MIVGVQRIYINGRFLGRPVTGVERFGRETVKALDSLVAEGAFPGCSFTILVPRDFEPNLPLTHIKLQRIGRRQGYFWEQIELLFATKGDFLLNLCNTAPVFKRRQAVVIHDAGVFSAPYSFSWKFRAVYKMMHWALAHGRSLVLSVSNFSKQDLIAHLPLTQDRVIVVPEGCEHIQAVEADHAVLEKQGLDETPYYLAVSSMAPHKNFRTILAALDGIPDPPFKIAIAGGNNSKVFGDAPGAKSSNVRWLGYVSDGELKALYSNALGFIFPSIYEGFGIPPLEAMQCGCPVIAARSASLPEVCGDAAIYFDPHKSAELAQQMVSLHQDTSLRSRLIDAGSLRARNFTWRAAALAVAKACRWLPEGHHA